MRLARGLGDWLSDVEPILGLSKRGMYYVGQISWWGRRDSNPHALRHMILSHARLPVPTRPRAFYFSSGASARLDERPVEGVSACASTGSARTVTGSHERFDKNLAKPLRQAQHERLPGAMCASNSTNGCKDSHRCFDRLPLHERFAGSCERSTIQHVFYGYWKPSQAEGVRLRQAQARNPSSLGAMRLRFRQ